MRIRIFAAMIPIVVLFLFMGGCSQRGPFEFAPDEDAKIQQHAVVAIEGAQKKFPAEAAIVYVKQWHEYYSDIVIGVRAGNFETVWLGSPEDMITEDLEKNTCPSLEKSFPKIHLQWISPFEPLLLISAEEDLIGAGAYHCWRTDTVVSFDGGKPEILLYERQQIRAPKGSSDKINVERAVRHVSTNRGIKVTLRDHATVKKIYGECKPLCHFRRDWNEGGRRFTTWQGAVETISTRTWMVLHGKISPVGQEMKYKAQDGDTWECIAAGFLGDEKYADEIRAANPNRPLAKGIWVDIPVQRLKYVPRLGD